MTALISDDPCYGCIGDQVVSCSFPVYSVIPYLPFYCLVFSLVSFPQVRNRARNELPSLYTKKSVR